MKICIVTTAFPRWANDGRAAFMLEAAQAIKRQGNEVRVIAMHNPGSLTREDMDGIDVIRPRYLPERWEILQKDSAGLPQAWQSNPWSRLAILPFLFVHTLAAARWTRGFDVIHANWTLSGASVWLTQWFHQRPYVVTVQGSDIFKAARMWFSKRLTSWVVKKADRMICLSEALAAEVKRIGTAPHRVSVIPNGVNVQKFCFDPLKKREPVILFVGSLIERKGVETLLKAFHSLKDALPDYQLVFIGEGELRGHLEQTARQLGISQRVTFTGFQSQESVHDWMQKARVFVLPSIEEGQGVVLLEALASGTPCVGTKAGGIPDVIIPEVGRLVAPGNAGELGEALLEIISSPKWEELSWQARRHIEASYDWNAIAEKICEVYRSVLAEKTA